MSINFADRASLLPIYRQIKLVEIEDLDSNSFFFADLQALTLNVGETYVKQHQRHFVISAPDADQALVWLQLHLENQTSTDLAQKNEYRVDNAGTFIVLSKLTNPPTHLIRYPAMQDIKPITKDELTVLMKFMTPQSITANFFIQQIATMLHG